MSLFKAFRKNYNPEALEKSEAESLIAALNGLAAGAGANLVAYRNVEGGLAGVGELQKSFRASGTKSSGGNGPVLLSRALPVRGLALCLCLNYVICALTRFDCDRDGLGPSRPFSLQLTLASRMW